MTNTLERLAEDFGRISKFFAPESTFVNVKFPTFRVLPIFLVWPLRFKIPVRLRGCMTLGRNLSVKSKIHLRLAGLQKLAWNQIILPADLKKKILQIQPLNSTKETCQNLSKELQQRNSKSIILLISVYSLHSMVYYLCISTSFIAHNLRMSLS